MERKTKSGADSRVGTRPRISLHSIRATRSLLNILPRKADQRRYIRGLLKRNNPSDGDHRVVALDRFFELAVEHADGADQGRCAGLQRRPLSGQEAVGALERSLAAELLCEILAALRDIIDREMP